MFIYLAGCISYFKSIGEFEKAEYWRDSISKFLQDNCIDYFNPVETYKIESNHSYSDKLIVEQNKYFLNKSDIMIVNLEEILNSPGTIFELVYASEVKKIPIIAFGENKSTHPHIMNCISDVVDSLDDVEEILINMFNI